jgi:hypothetical protein
VDHLFVRRIAGGELHLSFGPVAGTLHQLERLEHRLVVLVLVLQDHVVDEAIFEERIAPVEIRARKRLEGRLADGVEVAVGRGPVEHRERRTLAAGG